MKTPFDTADANRKFDAAERKLSKLIVQVAAGDQDAERSAFRTVAAIDDLRRWVDAGRDERRGHRARVVDAAEAGRLARTSGGEAEIARLRQMQREAQPLPGSYESELRLLRRNAPRMTGHAPNSGHGRAYRVWRGDNDAAAVYVTAPNVWGAVERAMDDRGWTDMDDVRAEVRVGGEWQPAVEHEANAESGTEYPIWGIPPGKTEEDLLYTRARTMEEAKRVCRILETEHGVTRPRIQVLDLTTPPDFSNVLTKPGRRHRRNGTPALAATDLRKMRVGDEVTVPCGPAGDDLFIKRTSRDSFFIRIPGHEHARWGTAQQAAEDIEQFVQYGSLPWASGASKF